MVAVAVAARIFLRISPAAVYTDIAAGAVAVTWTTTKTTTAMKTSNLTYVAAVPSFAALAVDAIRATHYSGNASSFDGGRHWIALTQVNDTY